MKPINEMTQAELEALNKRTKEQTDQDYSEFKADLAKDICWVCKQPLGSFDENLPCQHWLLKPDGFKKKHFKILFNARTIDKIESYLRWYASAFEPIKSINNLKDVHGGDVVKALTISHGQLEWSFSCAQTCFLGRHGSHGPHYHFQMRVNGKPFHDYSDRHIKLTPYEVWLIEIDQGKHPKLRHVERHGAGMQDIFDNVDSEILLDNMTPTDDFENATFHVSTLVTAKNSNGIATEDLNALLKEHRETGIPMHRLLHKLRNAESSIIIQPGDGVTQAAPRTKRNRGKSKAK